MRWKAIFACLFLFLNLYASDLSYPYVGQIEENSGPSWVLERNGSKKRAVAHMQLQDGESLKTGKGGRLVASFYDGTRLELKAGSWVFIHDLPMQETKVAQKRFTLTKGSFHLSPGEDAKRFPFSYFAAVVGVDAFSFGSEIEASLGKGKRAVFKADHALLSQLERDAVYLTWFLGKALKCIDKNFSSKELSKLCRQSVLSWEGKAPKVFFNDRGGLNAFWRGDQLKVQSSLRGIKGSFLPSKKSEKLQDKPLQLVLPLAKEKKLDEVTKALLRVFTKEQKKGALEDLEKFILRQLSASKALQKQLLKKSAPKDKNSAFAEVHKVKRALLAPSFSLLNQSVKKIFSSKDKKQSLQELKSLCAIFQKVQGILDHYAWHQERILRLQEVLSQKADEEEKNLLVDALHHEESRLEEAETMLFAAGESLQEEGIYLPFFFEKGKFSPVDLEEK